MNAEHRGKRRWRKSPDTYAEAAKRVRKQDRQHRCHARCEHAREVATTASRGCGGYLSTGVLWLGVLLAIIIAIGAITGKL